MRRLLLLALAPALLAADDHWVRYNSGPFELYTDAGGHAGRETLLRLEQFRNALGQMLGETDLQMPTAVRVFVLKNAKGWTTPAPVSEGRSTYNIVLDEKAAPGPAIYTELTRLLLAANTGRMPAAFEQGLVTFFSTLQVNGIRIIAGAPPPQPDLDWARVHLLVVSPEYFGKLRVLLYNLRKGVTGDAAYQNAFGKPAAAIEAEAKRHLAAGNFQTTTLPNRAMSERDFQERPVSDSDAHLARADLLAGSQSAGEYEALLHDQSHIAEAEEGLGLLALRDHKQEEARKHFEAATQAGSKSARCYIEYAKLEPDNQKATQALLRAAGINPKLDEPFALMAARDTDPEKQLAHWKAAAERNPRNAAYWQSLAEAYLEQKDFANAAKAWTQGEQAATDPAERERMRKARLAIEQQRLDAEDAERRKDAEDLEKLKDQARAQVHALEDKFKEPTPDKPVPWWTGPQPSGKISGSLKRVECLGKQARLSIEGDDLKLTRLLVTDPKQIVIIGNGDQGLGCGVQKARAVTVEYFPKANARLSTAGEVATIEFQ
jgi:hypothetical protein